jgi:YD repeat-containing protein
MTYANGVVTDYTYNSANMVTSVESSKGLIAISNYYYGYLRDGNIFLVDDNISLTSTRYTYDFAGRLKTEQIRGGAPITVISEWEYEYDSMGNRTRMTRTGDENYRVDYIYDLNNRMTMERRFVDGVEVDGSRYTYDANGNMLRRLGGGITGNIMRESYTYNAFNQVTEWRNSGGLVYTYAYKPNGMRLSKTEHPNATICMFGMGRILSRK